MINRRWLILSLAAPALLLTTAVLASSIIIDTIKGTITVNQVIFHDDWSCEFDLDPGEKKVRKYFIENRSDIKYDVGFTVNISPDGQGLTAEVDLEMFQISAGDTHEVTVVFEASGRAEADTYNCEIELSRGNY